MATNKAGIGGVAELMVARPDTAKGDIIYKHPDQTIPTKAQLTVDADEIALFFRDGKIVGSLSPGRHTLRSANIPFLSHLIDRFTGGNVLLTEIFFVTVREMPDFKFGGRIGSVEDPKSGIPVETMVHGTFSLRVTHPQQLLLGLVGLQATDGNAFVKWFRELLLKTIRDNIAELLVKKRWPLLDVTSGAYTEEIETEVVADCSKHIDDYGLKVMRLGNFLISIKSEDEQNLKKLYTDAAYVRMAGGMQGYQQFAAGKALLGAGEGMATGGASEGGDAGSGLLGGAGLGVGFGMASMFQQSLARSGDLPPAIGGTPPPFSVSPPNPFRSPPPPPFHIHLKGHTMGPYGLDVLAQGVASGEFGRDTPVWCSGMPDWKPAGKVPQLRHLFGDDDPVGGETPPPLVRQSP